MQGRSTKARIIGTNKKQEKTKEKDTREKDKKVRLRGKKAENELPNQIERKSEEAGIGRKKRQMEV